jgi:hypothetical protein
MCVNEKRADTVDGIKIFEWFLNICKENRIPVKAVESAQKA